MFDMSVAQGVKEGGKFLQAGIHNAIFKGISKTEIQGKTGDTFNVLVMTFEVEGFGDLEHKLFEPTSATRVESQFGQNPSQLEQFMIANRHLLDTANPTIAKGIDDGTVKIDAPNFASFVKKMQEYTADFVGQPVQIKVLPTKSGFNQMPGFPAKISKTGKLYLSTSFIGKDLTLTPYEVSAIEKAKNATPTNMAAAGNDLLAGMEADINSTDGEDGDLPF
jgi:hypothetical protein